MTPPQLPPAKGRGPKLTSAQAQARLADALRDNLRRRKAQMRARDDANDTPTEPGSTDKSPKAGGKTR
ncbi:MAG: hypothetical protein EXQ84_06875 [Rhodospirillaceae bacterium]|nr:hypothetical protein [Rhodospirillaceae bacterium]